MYTPYPATSPLEVPESEVELLFAYKAAIDPGTVLDVPSTS